VTCSSLSKFSIMSNYSLLYVTFYFSDLINDLAGSSTP
jgi:hypothetical protein